MAGVILLTAMGVAGISLWYKRRKQRLDEEKISGEQNDDAFKV